VEIDSKKFIWATLFAYVLPSEKMVHHWGAYDNKYGYRLMGLHLKSRGVEIAREKMEMPAIRTLRGGAVLI